MSFPFPPSSRGKKILTYYVCLSGMDRLHGQENINMEMILIKQEEVKYEMECFNLELIRLGQSF